MVNLKNCKWTNLKEKLHNKEVYCFGSGSLLDWISSPVRGILFASLVCGVIDNNPKKQGQKIMLDGYCLPVISFSQFMKKKTENTIVLITSMYYKEMIEQMDRENVLNGMECYIVPFLQESVNLPVIPLGNRNQEIPKKIHFCWFGKKELPSIYQKYIDTWKQFCPDYEIICWNETNYDVNKNKYMQQAYEMGQWAFVSDYARLDIVYEFGGIYLDTDIEIVKNFDDLLLDKMFCGFELGNSINTGIGFGACKNFTLLNSMKEVYDTISFQNTDGSLNLTPCTKYQTDFLTKLGLERNGQMQTIEGIKIYPRTVLAPFDFYNAQNMYTEYTHSIHHYAALWFNQTNNKSNVLEKNNMFFSRIEKNMETDYAE